MQYTEERKQQTFDLILIKLENGQSLRSILKEENMPSSKTFYEWLEADENKIKQYARSTDLRAEIMFEEILEISDKQGNDVKIIDGKEVIDFNIVARNRLQIDARKWMLGKMNPKKYGDRIQQEHSGKVEGSAPVRLDITLPDGKKLDDFKL